MAGNVWEWVNGWYDDAAYVNTEEGAVNPTGAGSGQMRVLRGGAWGDEVERARSTFRARHLPNSTDDQRGFRIVLYGQPDDQ
jgi:formylglycine-generating enzyme required for sulfatase activity